MLLLYKILLQVHEVVINGWNVCHGRSCRRRPVPLVCLFCGEFFRLLKWSVDVEGTFVDTAMIVYQQVSYKKVKYRSGIRRLWFQMCTNSPEKFEHHIVIPASHSVCKISSFLRQRRWPWNQKERMRSFTSVWNVPCRHTLLRKPSWNSVNKVAALGEI